MKSSFDAGFERQESPRERANQVAALIKTGDAGVAIQTIDRFVGEGLDLNISVYSDNKTFNDPTLLMVASAYGNQAVIEHLLQKGVSAKQRNADGLDSYVHAAKNGHVGIMQLLTQHGCDFKNAKQYGTMNSALHWAATYGQFEVVKFLEEQKVDLFGKSSEGYGLLHAAADSGNTQLIRYLLDKGFDPNAVGEGMRDMTPLMNAARLSKSPEAVQMLIDAGANVNQLDAFHRSALSWASYGKGNDEVIEVLLKAGADPTKKGETGVFALNIMSQDLGNDPISRSVKDLADRLLKDRYSPKPRKEGDGLQEGEKE